MKQNKLNILDCTLRDGGYYNNWHFDKDLINEYLKVMDIIKVDYKLTTIIFFEIFKYQKR